MTEVHFSLDLNDLPIENSIGLSISFFDCISEFFETGSPKALNFFWRERLSKRERKILKRSFNKLLISLSKRKRKLILESSQKANDESLERWMKSLSKYPPAEKILKREGFRPSLDSSVEDKENPTSKPLWEEAISNSKSVSDIEDTFRLLKMLK